MDNTDLPETTPESDDDYEVVPSTVHAETAKAPPRDARNRLLEWPRSTVHAETAKAPPLPDAFRPKPNGPQPCAEQRAIMETLGFRNITLATGNEVNWVTTGENLISLRADEVPSPAAVLAAIERNSINIGKRLQRQELRNLLAS